MRGSLDVSGALGLTPAGQSGAKAMTHPTNNGALEETTAQNELFRATWPELAWRFLGKIQKITAALLNQGMNLQKRKLLHWPP
jgi:hypothetical protein